MCDNNLSTAVYNNSTGLILMVPSWRKWYYLNHLTDQRFCNIRINDPNSRESIKEETKERQSDTRLNFIRWYIASVILKSKFDPIQAAFPRHFHREYVAGKVITISDWCKLIMHGAFLEARTRKARCFFLILLISLFFSSDFTS